MAIRFKWLIPILILVVVLVPLLGSIACTEVMLFYLVRSLLTCGIEIFVDGGYEGTTEQLADFAGCVFLGTITGGMHTLEFKAPSSVVAAASAAATGKATAASEVPDIRVTYKGPVVDGGRYEVKLSQATGGEASMQNDNQTFEALVIFEVSSEPFVLLFNPWDYDVDEDGVISKTEALVAVVDYFDGVITKHQALLVVALYFS